MDPTVPNPEPEREPRLDEAADCLHAEFSRSLPADAVEGAIQRLRDDEASREPLPDVTSWAAMSDDELVGRLRASADRELAGMDAATDDAEILAGMLLPEPMHYDPDRMDRLTPCGLDVPEIGADVTTTPALVTCPTCTSALVDSQLPPEPDACPGCGITELDGPHGVGCPSGAPAEHRTVGLEVLTDALRAEAAAIDADAPDVLPGGTVAIVMRVNGAVIDVPELDSLWAADFRKPADILSILLRQARMYADGLDGKTGAELLMPGPDVLSALAGTPFGSYTEPVETRWGLVRDGWYVLVETAVDGRQDFVWLLVEDRRECGQPDCTVAKGTPWACAVTTIRGRGVKHNDAFNPVAVRIPATTEVETR